MYSYSVVKMDSRPLMTSGQLIAYLCNSQDLIRKSMSVWVSSSPAFQVFAERHRYKIRAKIRRCGTKQKLRELAWELEVAHLFLKNREFQVDYEPYGSDRSRYLRTIVFQRRHNIHSMLRQRRSEIPLRKPGSNWEKEIKETVRAYIAWRSLAQHSGYVRGRKTFGSTRSSARAFQDCNSKTDR